MEKQCVAVFSGGSDLVERLRKSCSDFDFDRDEDSRVAVVDRLAASDSMADAPRFLSRILLGADSEPRLQGVVRRTGDLLLDRDYFLEHAPEMLSFACELAASRVAAEELSAELELLHEMQQLMRLGDSAVVSEKIVRHVLSLAGAKRGRLLLHDPKVERYVVSFSTESPEADSSEFLPGVDADGLQTALSAPGAFALYPREGNHRQLIVPLQVGEDMIGVLIALFDGDESVDMQAAQRAVIYVRRVSGALGNIYQLTRSRDLAMRDDLTKAFNRRFFESYLDEESERSRRYGTIFTVIFLDLDDLKRVNNRHGHLTGSRMLQEVARRILDAVRGIDKVVRFGGDEFCIILPQTDQHQSFAVAERVRRAIAEEPFRLENDLSIAISASFGIATYPLHAVTKEELISAADAAMYRVKSTTKNAIEIAADPPTLVEKKQMTL
ncbi:MAG TPA: GGDEF domain-containing protein [Thermoanaerobaculia bacterium]|nr:GGDEF domain-containing protein [Thermoanaerobaculia bacterium]